ncbi:MAG: helix-turn-helix transcriptional regulator [Nitrospirae bacterium]|nr:helix-turn-helix transcriptional regulator [Nitrospirota bacterium]
MADERDTPLYMIGIVARMLSIHPQTLRLYEREGLVAPKRSQGNTRLYSHRDVERVKLITHLTRDMGVNLAGVEVILNMRLQMEEMQHEMEGLIGYLREELRKEITRLSKGTEERGKGFTRKPAGKEVRVKAGHNKEGRR